jgi:hypothetical protein
MHADSDSDRWYASGAGEENFLASEQIRPYVVLSFPSSKWIIKK